MTYGPAPSGDPAVFKRRQIIGAIVFFAVLFILLSIGLRHTFDVMDQNIKFRAERRIVKICHDGTRIYEYQGQTMISSREPILPEACP